VCGICGILEFDGTSPEAAVLDRMRDTLAHRGPDGFGTIVAGPCGFGHRRLSIIDPDGSPQPMSDPATGSWLTYNGEIYNYRELRRGLEADGIRLRTSGDTEVVLQLLVREGPRALDRLNGIFAFGFWDGRARRLLVARDRLGIKPLYWWSDGRRFCFASEMKAFHAIPGFRPAMDQEALASYLIYSNVHGTRTLLEGVSRLPAGGYALVDAAGRKVATYWSLPEPDLEAPIGIDEATQRVGALVEDAVKLQMVSDVPVGSLCSGGLDSSLISALCVREAGHQFNTFNATFPQGPPFDESSFAREVSGHIGSRHHEILVDGDKVARGLVPLIWYNDEPIHHTSSIPIYYVARRARRYVKVLLSGEGADEMFAGYPRYRILRLAMFGRRPILGPLLRLIARGVPNARRRQKLLEHLGLDVREAILFNVTTVRREHLNRVLSNQARDAVGGARLEFENALLGTNLNGDHAGLLRRLLRFEQGTYLSTSLDRLDKMTMAASVEGRVPLLDHRLVEEASHVDAAALYEDGQGKAPLRRAARAWLPPTILERKKWGFGLPVASVLRSPELTPFVGLLWEKDARTRDVFDREALRGAWDGLAAGRDELGDLVWRALNLEVWSRLFVDRSLAPSPPPEEAPELS
jgi:asparagine synthase (glutamine-hydrolysing)